MNFRSGDIVKVKDHPNLTESCKVLEVQGAILKVEDGDGRVYEIFSYQCQKQMLFG